MSKTVIKTVNNEKGAMAILAVVVMSFVVVSTLSTVYIYIVNRAKYHGRIKDAYRLTHVMEEFGKLTRQAYDTAQALPPLAECPNGIAGSRQATEDKIGIPLCFPPCVDGGVCNKEFGNLCITHLGNSFCLEAGEFETVVSNEIKPSGEAQYAKSDVYEFGVVETKSTRNSAYSKWIARLDRFFESSVSNRVEIAANNITPILNRNISMPTPFTWIIREAQAFADFKEETCKSGSLSLPACKKRDEYKEKYQDQVKDQEQTQLRAGYQQHTPTQMPESASASGSGECPEGQFCPECLSDKPPRGCPQLQGVQVVAESCSTGSESATGPQPKTPKPNPGAECQYCNTSDCVRFAFCPDFMKPCGDKGRPYFREIVRIIR